MIYKIKCKYNYILKIVLKDIIILYFKLRHYYKLIN